MNIKILKNIIEGRILLYMDFSKKEKIIPSYLAEFIAEGIQNQISLKESEEKLNKIKNEIKKNEIS